MNNPYLHIDKLHPERWQDLKDLFLSAVSSDPDAFSTSYTDALSYPDEFWTEKLTKDEFLDLFLKEEHELHGMLAAHIKHAPDGRYATLGAFYVKPELRGKGYGKKLLITMLEKLSADKHVHKVQLCVRENQDTARALYEKLGFTQTGRKADALETENGFIDEIIMEKSL
jgi:ribosomal protein S18 acetylase RimI-like enzyme